jgi:hypothetical protein
MENQLIVEREKYISENICCSNFNHNRILYILKIILAIIPIILLVNNIIYLNKKESVEIDNFFELSHYENNYNFSKYIKEDSLNIKAIALYEPKIRFNNNNNYNILTGKYISNYLSKDSDDDDIYKNNEGKYEYSSLSNIENIKYQIELAKSHGIYGFGIYYYFYAEVSMYNYPLDIIYENKDIDFNFCLIWKNIDLKIQGYNLNIENQYKYGIEKFMNNIGKYILDERYIKLNGRPIIGIYSPTKIENINSVITELREKAKEIGIDNIFILGYLNSKYLKDEDIYQNKTFDGILYLPKFENLVKNYYTERKNLYYYRSLIYEFNITSKKDFPIYCASTVKKDINEIKVDIKDRNISTIFDDYSSYKFYLLNKILVNYTYNNFKKENRFIFIDSFNNFFEQKFLKKNGYASLNSLSKALFNLTDSKNYDLSNLQKTCLIAIQAHVYFIDLLDDIINSINNIPVKYDLYITTTSEENKKIIEEKVKLYTKANNFEILVMDNKGRDVLPFLNQIKKVYKKYKYLCHIHSKKTNQNPNLGNNWRKYLYKNILGNEEIISEILFNFESNDNLGIIYPDNFYPITNYTIGINNDNIRLTNYLLNKIFPLHKIGKETGYFPAGNMFWARIDAIHQIFEIDIEDDVPIERKQIDSTIIHAVERIWVYLAKLNGYYYTTTFREL